MIDRSASEEFEFWGHDEPVNRVQFVLERARLLGLRSAAVAFTTSSKWFDARWSSTTFQWHPTSEAPPIMGLVFDHAEPAKALFRTFSQAVNQFDTMNELRISIIEGSPEGQRHGYSVHLGPEMEMLQAMATAEDIEITNATMPFFGQVQRMYPIPGQPNLLARFKQEFAKHQQYMIAPVTKRADGQPWCNPDLGIIKSVIHFRELKDIQEDDVDAIALALPALIPP